MSSKAWKRARREVRQQLAGVRRPLMPRWRHWLMMRGVLGPARSWKAREEKRHQDAVRRAMKPGAHAIRGGKP